MKILLMSDAHANIDALRAVEATEAPFDLVMFAGDFVDWGFHPHEVIEWFRVHPHVAVSGNHDRYLLELWDSGQREEVGRETTYASHCVNQLTEEDIAFLRALPMEIVREYDGYTYLMKHSPREEQQADVLAEYMHDYRLQPFFDQLWAERVGSSGESGRRRMVFGHTHQCWMYQLRQGALLMNPGSLHYRKGPDSLEKGADYIVIADGVPVMHHVDYPTAHLRQRIRESNFPDPIRRPALVYAGSWVDGADDAP